MCVLKTKKSVNRLISWNVCREKEGIIGMDENEQPIYGPIYKELVDKEYPNKFTGWDNDIV